MSIIFFLVLAALTLMLCYRTVMLAWYSVVLIGQVVCLIGQVLWLPFAWLFDREDELESVDLSSVLNLMEDLVWHYKMFTVTKNDDGVKTEWNISLSELLEMEEVDEFTKEAAVRKFLTMVKRDMPADQADHVMQIIRQKLGGQQQLPSPAVGIMPIAANRW